MTDPRSTDSNEPDVTTNPVADVPKPPATPRWVKISGVVLALVVVAVLAKVLFGGGAGGHGPGMHGGLGVPSTPTSASSALAPVTTLPDL